MKVYLTRDSVCAADDVDAPHAITFIVPEGMSVGNLMKIVQASHLPKIQGGKATWSVTSGIPVAVIAQQWSEPKLLPPFELGIVDLDTVDGVTNLHVNYHAQLEPETVEEVLRELTMKAIRPENAPDKN